jgi:hypothetical protein
MSLPFTKGRPQQEDEQAVSREPRGKEYVKRWRGIEIGFKLRITKTRKYAPARPGHEVGLILPPNAALDVAAPGPNPTPSDEGNGWTEETLSVLFCVTPPTDPPRG